MERTRWRPPPPMPRGAVSKTTKPMEVENCEVTGSRYDCLIVTVKAGSSKLYKWFEHWCDNNGVTREPVQAFSPSVEIVRKKLPADAFGVERFAVALEGFFLCEQSGKKLSPRAEVWQVWGSVETLVSMLDSLTGDDGCIVDAHEPVGVRVPFVAGGAAPASDNLKKKVRLSRQSVKAQRVQDATDERNGLRGESLMDRELAEQMERNSVPGAGTCWNI